MPNAHRLTGDERRLPPTERRLPASLALGNSDPLEVLRLLNAEDRVAVDATEAVLPRLAEVVTVAADRMRRGGTVHYFGAGTSGRLGVLDAAELLPTFDLEPGRVVAHIAGGERALQEAVEDAEDSPAAGASIGASLDEDDVAIGLTASGNTPYVRGALEAARARGAYTVLVSNNPEASCASDADVSLVLDTGPEVITGSTRLKAGTSEKLVLNGFSTALMVTMGRTWSNLMVSVVATNAKLRDRTVRILIEATGVDAERARALLEETDGELKTAIVVALTGASPRLARDRLDAADDSLSRVLGRPPITTDHTPPTAENLREQS